MPRFNESLLKPYRRIADAGAEQFTDSLRPWRYAKRLTGLSALVCPDPASRLNAMNLDVNTLFLVTIYVEAILGLLLLFAWVQNTAIYAVAWWGFADLLRAASVIHLNAMSDV